MENENNEKRKNRLLWLIIILLVIIIIILLFFWRVGKVEEKCLVPTGNVDVFNIDVDCDCKNVLGDKVELNALDQVFVDDKNGNYIYQQNLRIFDYAAYEYDESTLVNGRIAPGTENSYSFVVHNDSNENVNYNILMYEESQYPINMKYRLKRNNEYIVGNDDKWVSADELKTTMRTLLANRSDAYILDWKWFDDDDEADSIAGENMTEDYKLNVRINFETIDKEKDKDEKDN